MYRTLISLLLCVSTVLSAPQTNSNITYVKRQLDLEYSQPEQRLSERESRIEKVPLTIPGNIDKDPTENPNKNSENTKTAQSNNSQPTYNYSDRIYSIKSKPKTNNNSTEKNIPSNEKDDETGNKNSDILSETNDSDIVPAESILNDRLATNDSAGLNSEIDATQSDEFVTENYEEESTVTTEADVDTTKAPTPRHLAKLSYFEKSGGESFSQNLIALPVKRKFRSRCRCEKIWNCAKLQISVPRCPEEYFMCCS